MWKHDIKESPTQIPLSLPRAQAQIQSRTQQDWVLSKRSTPWTTTMGQKANICKIMF